MVLSRVMAIAGALPYIQVVLSVLVVVCVLLQQTAASLGGAFGGNDNFSEATVHYRQTSNTLTRAQVINRAQS